MVEQYFLAKKKCEKMKQKYYTQVLIKLKSITTGNKNRNIERFKKTIKYYEK